MRIAFCKKGTLVDLPLGGQGEIIEDYRPVKWDALVQIRVTVGSPFYEKGERVEFMPNQIQIGRKINKKSKENRLTTANYNPLDIVNFNVFWGEEKIHNWSGLKSTRGIRATKIVINLSMIKRMSLSKLTLRKLNDYIYTELAPALTTDESKSEGILVVDGNIVFNVTKTPLQHYE